MVERRLWADPPGDNFLVYVLREVPQDAEPTHLLGREQFMALHNGGLSVSAKALRHKRRPVERVEARLEMVGSPQEPERVRRLVPGPPRICLQPLARLLVLVRRLPAQPDEARQERSCGLRIDREPEEHRAEIPAEVLIDDSGEVGHVTERVVDQGRSIFV